MKRGEAVFNVLRVPLDYALLVGAGVFVYAVRVRILDTWWPVLFGPQLSFGRYLALVLAVSVLFVLVYAIAGLYVMKLRMTAAQEAARIVVASAGAMMVVILVIFLRAELFNSRFLVVGYWIAATGFMVMGRFFLRLAYRAVLARTGWGAHRVLLIGNDATTRQISDTIEHDPGMGYRIVRRLQHPDTAQIAAAVDNPGIDEVMLADPDYPAPAIVELVDFCHDRHIRFTFVPNIHRTLTTHWDVDAIGRTPIVQLRRTALDGWGHVFKRVTDMIGASIALILLSPFFALISFAIKWETAGPVFVRLRRVSRGREFFLFKFRSMIENAEELLPLLTEQNERSDGPLFKMKNDPRITRMGSFLRRTRIDELPQFWNVFRGDIALVGPRPHQPDEIARYARHHRRVLDIKAGATGLAQVSGSSDLSFEEEVTLDTFYIENWSWWMDIRIVFRTVFRMFNDRSAV